jgi:lipopolysaccharide transport system ATP-binding protein
MNPIIEIRGLSKSYTINHKDRASYSTIKDDFSTLIKSPLGKKESHEEKFWALKDVSFDVMPGEIYGIIGRNGSGKSTLLKILSRVVEPTKGTIKLNGKTASLLEVGTGFHPELTGRENIFFNGSMLGMSRKEIQSKFNEIVEFSEIGQFIDTPVKFYSSGMYVRLAFSVAAHLDPDILILDEVLSVGDASFQQKSMKKIRSTMENGTTVLFVSHSMASVQQLCSKAIMLNKGKIEISGTTDEVTERYNMLMKDSIPREVLNHTWTNDGSVANEHFVPESIYIEDDSGKRITSEATNDTDKWVVIEGNVVNASANYTLGFTVKSEHKSLLYMTYASDYGDGRLSKMKKGKVVLKGKIPAHFLNEGSYTISLVGGIYNEFWIFDPEAATPAVELSVSGGLSNSRFWKQARSGLLAPNTEWKVV